MKGNELQINEIVDIKIEQIANLSKEKKPLVAIHCLTYNHEPYLRDALDGFIMQQTNFPFVAIVHEDASTDGTAEVLREYAEKYPDIILPIFEKENQYSKPNGELNAIMNKACGVTGAKYIAMCEGDDYWTDPLKLQKQVDFLESHPEYSMCFHSANIKYEEGVPYNKFLESNYNHLQQREYSIDEIHASFIVPTCSVIFRMNVINNYRPDPDYFVGDNILWTACAASGRIFCLKNKMSFYRINNGGWIRRHQETREIRVKTYKQWHRHYRALRKNYPEVSSVQIYNQEIKYASIITFTDVKPIKNVLKNIYIFLPLYGARYIVILVKYIISHIYYKIKNLFKQ